MSATLITILVSVSTFFVSVGVSAFIGGTRWGTVQSEVRYINDRLAKIEGMFTLTVKKDGNRDA